MAKRKTTTARNSNTGKPDPAAADADLSSSAAEQTAAQNRIYQQVFEEITRFISTIQTQEKEVELCGKEEIQAELEYKEAKKKRIY